MPSVLYVPRNHFPSASSLFGKIGRRTSVCINFGEKKQAKEASGIDNGEGLVGIERSKDEGIKAI